MGLRRVHCCTDPDPPGWSRSTTGGASDAGSLALHLLVLLARPRRLAVPPLRYVVRAAPGSARMSALCLPSASRNRCNGPGWRSRSTRFIGASWRTAELVDDQQIYALEPAAEAAELLRVARLDQRAHEIGGAMEGDATALPRSLSA